MTVGALVGGLGTRPELSDARAWDAVCDVLSASGTEDAARVRHRALADARDARDAVRTGMGAAAGMLVLGALFVRLRLPADRDE